MCAPDYPLHKGVALTWNVNKDIFLRHFLLLLPCLSTAFCLFMNNLCGMNLSMNELHTAQINLQLLNCDAAVFTECRMLPGLVWLTVTRVDDYACSSFELFPRWVVLVQIWAHSSAFRFNIRGVKWRELVRCPTCLVSSVDIEPADWALEFRIERLKALKIYKLCCWLVIR